MLSLCKIMAVQFGATSFIPKKPETPTTRRRRGGTVNVFFLLALIIFLAAVTASVGVFLYERVTSQSLGEKKEQLERARAAFEPELIKDLTLIDLRIQSAESILNSHIAFSAFFTLLETMTLKTIQFDSFSYSLSDNGSISIQMKGRGLSFSSVALQSDVFGKDPYIQNPIFSDLDLDDVGKVVFSFAASVDPALVSYRRLSEGITKR